MAATERGAPSDDDLLRLLRDGDEAAFTALYRRWQGPVYRFALRMSGREALADDVVQETFLTVVHGMPGFEAGRGSLAGWLFGVARNQILRRLRRERPFIPLSDHGAAAEVPASDDVFAEVAERRELERLRRAVLALPEHYREALVLCGLQGVSYEDAAEALGCAVGTVRSRLSRGRELLAARLGATETRSAEDGRMGAAGGGR
ncbi:MAG TPA: RNA polymerase sigma factor [Vicinamibacteria bacterium]|nr:RNA polymerase sigma factor [Vicinamibacteria bacterium]